MMIFSGQSPSKSLEAFLETVISNSNSNFCKGCAFFTVKLNQNTVVLNLITEI